jgi:hypothetical protein
MDKQYRTKDGQKVRIYAVDHWGEYPVVGAVLCGTCWVTISWREDGVCSSTNGSNLTLVEVKPRIQREYWVNVKHNDYSSLHYTRKAADTYPDDRIACVKITIDCEEGEGL